MKVLFRFLLLLLLCCSASTLFAQEELVGVKAPDNMPPKKAKKSERLMGIAPLAAPLSLPFLDDFSQNTGMYPNADKWESNGVLVNNFYAINPPSIGVLTFDIFDKDGKPYEGAGTRVVPCDSLTSQPINLQFSAADSVYLSFFYQPAGLADLPEANDTLSLQFYSPLNNEWENVWTASCRGARRMVEINYLTGGVDTVKADSIYTRFKYTFINIKDSRFLQDEFRFRFVNFGSRNLDTETERKGNADHWNLDFVYLDKNRTVTDSTILDIAMVKPQHRITNMYESVPMAHLRTTDAQQILFSNPMVLSMTYRNLGWGTRSVTRRFEIKTITGEGDPAVYRAGSENIYNDETVTFNYETDQYPFNLFADSTELEISSYLITDNETSPLRRELRNNDTTRYYQKFFDYYAYDDGSAEMAYGLRGTGAEIGQVAVKFRNFKADTLRGVYLYFPRYIGDENAQTFQIAIWNDFDGYPDEQLLIQQGIKPVYKDSLNAYTAYKLTTPIFIERGTFYIGFVQSSNKLLGIGYDANTVNNDKIYYRLRGDWEQSTLATKGSVMIRPIFCTADKFPPDHVELPEPTPANNQIKVFPNPATDYIRFVQQNGDPIDLQNKRIEVYDMGGRLVLNERNLNSWEINVSNLKSGFYLVRIIENGKLSETKKILISR